MSKKTETETVDLKQEAVAQMEIMVEQHNKLVQELEVGNNKLTEIKNKLVEHQGYMKGLDAYNNQEEN